MKTYKFISLFCLVFIFTTAAYSQNKKDISVLYVGYSSKKSIPKNLGVIQRSGATPERFKADYGKRMPSFKKLLSTYFTKVKTVDARDYKEEMSAHYDVTIFDQVPTPLKKRSIIRDPKTGKVLRVNPAQYVSSNYDYPTIFIGYTAAIIGASLGSKLDWYCLCLDKYAHHINLNNPIFKGPFKVDITLKDRPTPKPIYDYFDGVNVPKIIPMWKVNTEGYEDGKGYRCGLVARGWGFEDSPNAEVISSGTCEKSVSAVALGRHGNFFLWGFAGSPKYMTAEAKKVFANVVVYIHKHAQDKIIAHKYNESIATRKYIDELAYSTTEAAYKSYAAFMAELNVQSQKGKQKLKKKKAAGKKLTEMEQMMINVKPQPMLTQKEWLTKTFSRQPWIKETGINPDTIRKFLKENRPYFFSDPYDIYILRVDQDIKSLGISNTNIKVLDKAISMLGNKVDVAKAYRILMRYTLEDFKTAKAWRTWFEKYKDKMFFTQTGGYVWMINDPNANPDTRPRSEKEIANLKFGTANLSLK